LWDNTPFHVVSTNELKEEFFFADNLIGSTEDGLSYDWTTLTITVPSSKIYNYTNFGSAFRQTVMDKLSNLWIDW